MVNVKEKQQKQQDPNKSIIKSIEKIMPANYKGISMKQREHAGVLFIPTTKDISEDEILNKEIINKCKINEK
jgi:hypothetical protein